MLSHGKRSAGLLSIPPGGEVSQLEDYLLSLIHQKILSVFDTLGVIGRCPKRIKRSKLTKRSTMS